jgi:hypothetical protein
MTCLMLQIEGIDGSQLKESGLVTLLHLEDLWFALGKHNWDFPSFK